MYNTYRNMSAERERIPQRIRSLSILINLVKSIG
jgi:hypothetical protein